MIAIIDYDAGNLKSVEKALTCLGQEAEVTRDAETILRADKVILPGVGSFGDAMDRIREYGLEETIRQVTGRGTPFLGICLGLQLLFEESEESPGVRGLGLIKGKIVRIPESPGLKIPHIGWNSLRLREGSCLFGGIEDGAYVYFVHSYCMQPEDAAVVAAVTEYGADIPVAVETGNIFACQFHPEKSSEVGLRILRNFAEL